MDDKYYKKYIKYKSKYFELKGGANHVTIEQPIEYKQTLIHNRKDKDNIENSTYIYTTIYTTNIYPKITHCFMRVVVSETGDYFTYNDIRIENKELIDFIRNSQNKTDLTFIISDIIDYSKYVRVLWIKVVYLDKILNKTTDIIQQIKIPLSIEETDDVKKIDEIKPPHKEPIFKKLMKIYLAIMSKVIKTEGSKIKDENFTVGNKTVNYISSNKYFCSFMEDTNKRGVHLFSLDNMLIICFADNDHYEPNTLIDTFHLPRTNQYNERLAEQEPIENNPFYIWILHIIGVINNENITSILLCGHSDGMRSATTITVLLFYLKLYMSNPEQHTDKKSTLNKVKDIYAPMGNILYEQVFTALEKIGENNKESKLKSIDLYLVGTGGRPNMLDWLSADFLSKLLNGKYLHIGLCNKEGIIDGYMGPKNKMGEISYTILKIYDNYKYHIYNKDTLCYNKEITHTHKSSFFENVSKNSDKIYNDGLDAIIEVQSLLNDKGLKDKDKEKNKAEYEQRLLQELKTSDELHKFETYRNVLLPFFV